MPKFQLEQVIPTPNIPSFTDYQSDEALARIVFNDIGCHRLEAVKESELVPEILGSCWKVDMNSVASLPVRSGFMRYGGCAYFDNDKKPLAIRGPDGVLSRPGDGALWEFQKFGFRCTLVLVVTAVDHLMNLHFGTAGVMLLSAVEGLDCEHPLRRAIHPFLMRTALINNKAGDMLLPDNNLLVHMSAWNNDEIRKIAKAEYKNGPEWRALPLTVEQKNLQALIDAGHLPYYEDGLEVFNSFRDYFKRVVAICNANDGQLEKFWAVLRSHAHSKHLPETFTEDALLDALAQFAFSVTAHHEHVGSISGYLIHPDRSCARIRPGSTRADAQSFILGATLIALTSLRTPKLLSSFEHFWRSDEERMHWSELQAKLTTISEVVDSRNEKRASEDGKWPFMSCNPKILECSVNV